MSLNDFIERLFGEAGSSAQAAAQAELMELAEQMTAFDRQTAMLCAQTWRSRGSSDDIVYGGMLRVLKAACEGGLDEDMSPRELLDAGRLRIRGGTRARGAPTEHRGAAGVGAVHPVLIA